MINESMADIKHRMLVFETSRWIGIKEVGGDNKGQIVEMFQRAVAGKAVGQAWCLSFIKFCIQMTDDLYNHIFLSSNPRTQLIKTEHCLTLWKNSEDYRVDKPFPGCIMLWQFYKDGVATSSGHAELVKEVQANGRIITIGGNTSDGTGVNRDGDGVYLRDRDPKGSASMRVLGFLRVWQ